MYTLIFSLPRSYRRLLNSNIDRRIQTSGEAGESINIFSTYLKDLSNKYFQKLTLN